MTFSVMWVLNFDERWNNLREYGQEVYSENAIGLIFGIVITIVMPLISVLQNIIFGLFLNVQNLMSGTGLKKTWEKIVRACQTQVVFVYDPSNFYAGAEENAHKPFGKSHLIVIIAHLFYV